jgi:hypothetical protein
MHLVLVSIQIAVLDQFILTDRFLGICEEFFSGFCQADSFIRPLKKSDPDLFLKLPDRRGEGRLGYKQAARGLPQRS